MADFLHTLKGAAQIGASVGAGFAAFALPTLAVFWIAKAIGL